MVKNVASYGSCSVTMFFFLSWNFSTWTKPLLIWKRKKDTFRFLNSKPNIKNLRTVCRNFIYLPEESLRFGQDDNRIFHSVSSISVIKILSTVHTRKETHHSRARKCLFQSRDPLENILDRKIFFIYMVCFAQVKETYALIGLKIIIIIKTKNKNNLMIV